MATNHKAKFKKAIVKAKKLYKTGRYNKFSDAVKAAYNSLPGKTTSLRAKRSKQKSRSVGSKPKRRVAVKSAAVGCSISGLKSQLRNKAKDQMRSALLARELATTKVAKRRQTKRIQKLKQMLKTYN